MTPKPETQGETYAALLGKLRTRFAEHKALPGFSDHTEAMRLLEWQAARIKELRKVADHVYGLLLETRLHEGTTGQELKRVISASARAAVIEVKP